MNAPRMNALAFISPTFPVPRRRQPSISISRSTPVLFRQQTRATANKPTKSLNEFSSYLLYTVTPLLITNPLSALAQTTKVIDSNASIDPSQVTQSDLDNSLTSRILGWTAFVLLVIASVGSIILSINNFITSRDDKKHRQWVQDRIDGKPYPKNLWSPDADTTFPQRAGQGGTAEKGMNREMRRMEKRAKDKEERERKRKEKLAEQRGAAKADKEQPNK